MENNSRIVNCTNIFKKLWYKLLKKIKNIYNLYNNDDILANTKRNAFIEDANSFLYL